MKVHYTGQLKHGTVFDSSDSLKSTKGQEESLATPLPPKANSIFLSYFERRNVHAGKTE